MLKKEILRLLKEDEEFRYAVAGLIGMDKILDELKSLREGQEKLWEEVKSLRESQEKLWEKYDEQSKNLQKLWENVEKLWEEVKSLRENQEKLWEKYDQLAKGQEKLWEKYDEQSRNIQKLWEKYDQLAKGQEKLWEEVKSLREDFSAMNRKLDALGARWGIMSEAAFRETLKGILEKDFKAKVEKWVYNDEEGFVFGYPSIVDIDLVIKDGKIILVEVKSHIGENDVAILYRKAKFYEKVTGKKPDEIIASSPYIDESAKKVCEKLGIRTYTV